MRWIFWTLLLGNLLVGAWWIAPWRAPAPVPVQLAPVTDTSHAEPFRLLSEMKPEELASRSPAQPVLEPAPTDTPQALCVMVGAFADEVRAQDFIARLAVLDVAAFLNPVDLSVGEGYWVYLEPLVSREESRRRLAELQDRGVDSYIIPKGELENGISLGMFTKRDLAELRLKELVDLGINAKIQEIKRSYREIWVMLGVQEEQKIATETWQKILKEPIPLQQRQNLCTDIASGKNFL
jgi:cell division septation protein DedD